MPFPKAKGNKGWENRRTGYGGERARRKRMKELYNKRREKLEANQQPADENLADVEVGGAPPVVNESLPATPEPTADPQLLHLFLHLHYHLLPHLSLHRTASSA